MQLDSERRREERRAHGNAHTEPRREHRQDTGDAVVCRLARGASIMRHTMPTTASAWSPVWTSSIGSPSGPITPGIVSPSYGYQPFTGDFDGDGKADIDLGDPTTARSSAVTASGPNRHVRLTGRVRLGGWLSRLARSKAQRRGASWRRALGSS